MQDSRRQQLELRKQELQNALQSYNSEPIENDRAQILSTRKQELLSALPTEPEEEFSYPRYLAEKVAQGVTNIADLPHVMQQLLKLTHDPNSPVAKKLAEKAIEEGRKPYKTPEIPMISPHLRKGLKQTGIDIETQKPSTPFQRMLGKGAEILGESAMGPLSSLGRRAAIGATIGTTAGGLEEFGANPTAATIGTAIGVPTVTGIAKGAIKAPLDIARYAVSPKYREQKALKTAEEEAAKFLRERIGEESLPEVIQTLKNAPEFPIPLTTAEKAKNVGLAQIERSLEAHEPQLPARHAEATGAVHEKLKGIIPEEYNIEIAKQHVGQELRNLEEAREKALSSFEHKLPPAEAGEKIGKEVRSHYKELRQERRRETAPLYEEVKNIETPYNIPNVNNAFREELRDAKGSIKKKLEKIQKDFRPALTDIQRNEYESLAQIKSSYDRMGISPNNEHYIAIERELRPYQGMRPNELKNAISNLSDEILSAEKAGREAEATILKKIKKASLEDIGRVPEEAVARSKYAELSIPITERRKHPVVGKILKKDYETKNYLIGESEIPSQLINKSMKTKEYAEDYIKTYGNRKNVLDDTKKYINHDIVESITHEGNVDLKALEKWKKTNPYYETIYPELKTKLSNVQNAQKMVNDAYVKNMKEADSYYKGAFKLFMHEDSNKIIRSIFESPYKGGKFDRVIEIAKKDKTGDSLEAIKRAVINDLMAQTRSASLASNGLNNFIPNQFLEYMKKNRKNMEKVFDENQMKLLDQIADYMHRKQFVSTAGFAKGSPTAPNKSIIEIMSDVPSGVAKKLLTKIYGVDKIVKFFDADSMNMVKNAKRDLIKEALLDSDRALYLLEKPMNKKALHDAYQKIKDKSFMAVPIGLSLEKENENE